MRIGGCVSMLLCVLVGCSADAEAPPNVPLQQQQQQHARAWPSHVTWRMEATAHVASLAIRNLYCKLEPERACDAPAHAKLRSLQLWAASDSAWTRLLASLSNYELGRRFWQQQDYQRSLEVVEWSIAYKLFPYQDPALQAHWQEKLMGADRAFKRPRLELADGLILMANSMFEVGRRQGSVEHLYLALEAIHLAAALMHNSMDLVHEVLSHLEVLSQHVARSLTHALPLIKAAKLAELVEVYGAACDACERRDLIQALLVRLSLPVRFDARDPSGVALTVTHPTFVHDAYVRQPSEGPEQFSRRLMQQLVGMIRLGLLTDLNVPCHDWADERDCDAHHASWHGSGGSGGGASNWTGNSSSSSSSSSSSTAGGTPVAAPPGVPLTPAVPLPRDSQASLIDGLFTGSMHDDLQRLTATLDLLTVAAGPGPGPPLAVRWQQLHGLSPDVQAGRVGGAPSGDDLLSQVAAWEHTDLGPQLDWQSAPPFPPPPDLLPGAQARVLGRLPPLPFKPPRPTVNRPPSLKKVADPAHSYFMAQRAAAAAAAVAQRFSAETVIVRTSSSDPKPPPLPPDHRTQHQAATGIGSNGAAAAPRRQQDASCCDRQKGVLTCCDTLAGDSGGSAPGSRSGGGGGGFSFNPWLHTRGIWASFQDSPLRPFLGPQAPEQLAKKGETVQPPRDDPLVVLLLSGLSATAMLSYTVLKNRRRVGRLLSGGMLGWWGGAQAPVATGGGPTPGTTGPGSSSSSSSGDTSSAGSHRRKAAAAALKDAVAGMGGKAAVGAVGATAAARLEAALHAAEAAGLQDAALVQRAEALLEQQQQQHQQQQMRRRGGSSGGGGASPAAVSAATAAVQQQQQKAGQRPRSSLGRSAAANGQPQPSPPLSAASAAAAADPTVAVGNSWLDAELSLGFPSLNCLLACVFWWSSRAKAGTGGTGARGPGTPAAAAAAGSADARSPTAPVPPDPPSSQRTQLQPDPGEGGGGKAAQPPQPLSIPARTAAADAVPDAGSPHSTSTGSSFAERFSSTAPLPHTSSTTAAKLPAQPEQQLPSGVAAAIPYPGYSDVDAYMWEAQLLASTAEEVGWQEGRRKRSTLAAAAAAAAAATAAAAAAVPSPLSLCAPTAFRAAAVGHVSPSPPVPPSERDPCRPMHAQLAAAVKSNPSAGNTGSTGLPALAVSSTKLGPQAAVAADPVAAVCPPTLGATASPTASRPAASCHKAPAAPAAPSSPASKPAAGGGAATAAAASKVSGDAAILKNAKPVKTKLGAKAASAAAPTAAAVTLRPQGATPPAGADPVAAAVSTPPSAKPSPKRSGGGAAAASPAQQQGVAAAGAAAASPSPLSNKPASRASFASSHSYSPSHLVHATSGGGAGGSNGGSGGGGAAALPSLSSLSLSPTCLSSSSNSANPRRSPEHAGAYQYSMHPPPPPPPPPPPRTPNSQHSNSPHAGTPAHTSSSSGASPLGTHTTFKQQQQQQQQQPMSAGGGSNHQHLAHALAFDEPNPFAKPSAAAFAAAASAAAAFAAFSEKRSSNGGTPAAPHPPGFAAKQRLLDHPSSAKHSPAHGQFGPFKALGNGAHVHFGSFQSADYDGILDSRHASQDHERALFGSGGAPEHAQQEAQPALYQPLYMGLGNGFADVGGRVSGAAGGGGQGGSTGSPAGAFQQPGSSLLAGDAPALLFSSSSVWSHNATALGASGDGGGSWLAPSASVPLIRGAPGAVPTVPPPTPAAPSPAAPAPAAAAQQHQAPAAASGPNPSLSLRHMWASPVSSLYGGPSSTPWAASLGLPLGGNGNGAPAPSLGVLSHGHLPQIPSESDLLNMPFAVADAEQFLGSSPSDHTTEAPEWAHQIMSVVE